VVELFRTALPPPLLEPLPLIGGPVLGTLTAALAALLPARQAGKVTPLEALTSVEADLSGEWRWVVHGGAVLCVVTSAVLLGCMTGGVTPLAAVPAAMVWLLSLAMLLPLAWRPLVGAAARLASLVAPCEARLALHALDRQPLRTSLTVSVLFLGVAASVGIGNSTLNNIEDVRRYVRGTIVGDYFLRVMNPRMDSGLAADLPPSIEPRVRALRGVRTVEAVRFVRARIGDQPIILIARDFPEDMPLPVVLQQGDPATLREQLAAGEVLLGTALANRLHKRQGEEVVLETPSGERHFRIAGTVTEYTVGGMVMVMDMKTAARELGVEGVDVLLTRTDPEYRGEVGRELSRLAEQEGLLFQSQDQHYSEINRMVSGVEGSLFAMLAIGVVITAFGVVDCLTLNVIEQTRELGTLRAIGMTRKQLRRSILAQAWLFAAVAMTAGLPVGLFLSYLVKLCTLPLLGNAVEYDVHYTLVLGFAIGGTLVIFGSGYLPARRAAALSPLEALRVE
jgi:putative ABC transport system permease protein